MDPVTLGLVNRRLTRGYEGLAWLGDSLTANGSTPSSGVYSVNTGVSAGATSVILDSPWAGLSTPVAPTAGALLIFEPGTASEEHVVIPTGGVSGTGPYTVTVPALTYAHAAGAAVRTEARQWDAKSIPMWVHLLSGGRLRFGGVFAHGGYTAQQIQSIYLPQVLAAKPAACVVTAGTNPGTYALTDIPGSIVPMWRSLLAAGILPIAACVPPQNTLVSSSAYKITRFNARLIYEARKLGIPVYDTFAQMADTGAGISGSGGYLTTYNYDNTHPSEIGTRVWAQGLVNLIDKMGLLRPVDPFLFTVNTYTGDAVTYPAGALTGNAVFLNGASGLPTGWTKSQGNAGDTVTLGAVTGIVGQGWTITRAANGTTDPIFVTSSFTGVPGNRYRVGFKLQTSGLDAAYDALRTTTGTAGGNTSSTFIGFDVVVTTTSADTDTMFSLKTWTRDVPNVATVVGEFVMPAGLSSNSLQIRVRLRGSASTPAYSVTLGQPTFVNLAALGI